jgi:hypothetical protein
LEPFVVLFPILFGFVSLDHGQHNYLVLEDGLGCSFDRPVRGSGVAQAVPGGGTIARRGQDVVKKLLDAFLTKKQLQELAR